MILKSMRITNIPQETFIHELNDSFTISGVVKENDMEIPCRVRLYERLTGRLLDEVLTDIQGRYTFTNIQPTPVYVIAVDKNNIYNAVMQDGIRSSVPAYQTNKVDNVLNSTYALNTVIDIPITVNGDISNVVSAIPISGVTLPIGITIRNNRFTGTFIQRGYYDFTISVLDSDGNYLYKGFSIWVGP